MFEEGKTYITKWKKAKDEIAVYYNRRNYQQAIEPMRQQIYFFKQSLFLLNKNQKYSPNDNFRDQVNGFKYKPVNVLERVEFIENHTKQYQCYIQLNELYDELEKIYARAAIIESD